ncbi:MAG: DUF1364 family protein [Nitrosomonas sp.]|nr:DUF1364 family protein [Nitrosomonas sp.]
MSKKITESARGKECQVRIPHVCSHNPGTSSLGAHQNGRSRRKWTEKQRCSGCYALPRS